MTKLAHSKYKNQITLAINILLMYLFSAGVYLLMLWIYTGSSLISLRWALEYPVRYLGEATIIFLAMTVLYTACRRASVSIFTVGFLACFYASVNYFKVFFRQEPVLPWDFYNMSMAVSTLPMIDLKFPMEIYASAAILVITLILGLVIEKKWLRPARISLVPRLILPVGLSLVLVLFVNYIAFDKGFIERNGIWINRFIQIDNYRDNGLISAFFRNIKFLDVDMPEGYSKEAIDKILAEVTPTTTETDKPNIIILMNESFTDPARYKNAGYTEDLTPFFHSLQQTCINGYIMGNQFGGGTANTEFDVLTGFTVAYMPQGGVPFQQYFNVDQPSYVSYLKAQGYNTLAVHSYEKHFWNRDTAYPSMGFDDFIADDEFPRDAERKRGYISDLEVSKMIIRQYEENEASGKPFFVHAVTVQNHVEYQPDQYSDEDEITLTSNPFFAEQAGAFVTYLTGLKYADQALEYLVDYFDSIDEPTIILFFGDHLGKIGSYGAVDYMTAGYLANEESAQNTFDFYSTPYVVWDNYTDKKAVCEAPMCMYQLLPSIAEWYNLPRPAFFNFLLEQQKTYRGTAESVYLGTDGKPMAEASEKVLTQEEKYIMLQYDNFFGERYGNEKLTK